jgi:hypothetical protein
MGGTLRATRPLGSRTVEEDPQTEELRLKQSQREREEREAEDGALTEEDTEVHRRRAEKSAYLREKLEERAESERSD